MIEFRGELADDCTIEVCEAIPDMIDADYFDIKIDNDPTVQGGIDLIWDALPYRPPPHSDCRCSPVFFSKPHDTLDIQISGTSAASVNTLFHGLYADQPVKLETRPWGEYWFMPHYQSVARPRYPARDGDDFEIAFDVETTQDQTDYRFRARLMRWLWRWLPGFSDLYPVLKGKSFARRR